MPYTILGKNLMLDALKGTAPGAPVTHAGLLTAQAALAATTGVAATDILTKNAHGLANGDLVILTALTGGAGLKAGNAGNADELAEPFFVIGVTANTFQISRTPGGAAADFTTDIVTVSVTKLAEIAGGAPAYARKAIAFAAAAGGLLDDSTNGAVFDVPAAGQVNYVGFYSALAAGTLQAIDLVTQEVFGGQGTYTLTDAKLNLNL